MENVIQYLKNNNIMNPINFNSFVESNEFNDLDEDSKKDIFYMVAFSMSTKDYSLLDDVINDFVLIITFINENEYLHDTQELYEFIVNNYLNNIDDLLKPCFKKNQEIFINNLHKFTESLKQLYFANEKCKKSIIKELENLSESLYALSKKIEDKYQLKFKRYLNDLKSNISEQDNDEDDNKNKPIEQNMNLLKNISNNKNLNLPKNNINNKHFLGYNNIDINIENKNIISDNINLSKKYFNNNEYKKVSINNDLNNENYKDIFILNNINNIIDNDNNNNHDNNQSINNSQEYNIINNKSRIYDSKNSLNNSEKYHDSMMFINSVSNLINDIVEAENKEEEEEKVQEIDEEINNFIEQIYPMFNSKNNNEEDYKFIKKRYLKNEEINENINNNNININANNIQNINNNTNININNFNKPKKKKKKGKKKKNN